MDPAQSLHPELVLLVLELHRGRTAMDFHPCKSSGGLPVNVHFKIRAPLLDAIRGGLRRGHDLAYEPVGWISAGVSRIGDGRLFLFAQTYPPAEDAAPSQETESAAGRGR